MQQIVKWCDENRLTINEQKTKYTVFNNKSNDSSPTLKCKDHSLENVNSYKNLGVDITSNLDMNNYVHNVYKKANYKVYMFSKIRKYITKFAAIMIYKQTILPYMDYCSFVMDSACQYSLSKLDKIQKRSIRLIEYKTRKDQRKDINILLKEYYIQPIRERRVQQLLCFIYQESKNKI